MSDEQDRAELARYWMEKPALALAAARRERAAGDLALAMNRVYYACFYAASAVFAASGTSYGKRTAVRSALHQQLVKTGRLAATWGAFYNRAFDDRQEADYEADVAFGDADVAERVAKAQEFVREMKRILSASLPL